MRINVVSATLPGTPVYLSFDADHDPSGFHVWLSERQVMDMVVKMCRYISPALAVEACDDAIYEARESMMNYQPRPLNEDRDELTRP